MTCPVCNGDTKVTNTYMYDDHVIRYRICRECRYRFHTIETDTDMYQRLEKGNTLWTGEENDKRFRKP